MKKLVTIEGKELQVEISNSAIKHLLSVEMAIVAEMELYFSCLIRKKMRFHESLNEEDDAVQIMQNLRLRFHPIMTQICGKDYEGDEPPTTDFPIVNVKPYIPHWVRIDFKSGQWCGEFGYSDVC